MRIGIFSLAYIPFVGGAEIALKEITDRLPDRDFVCFTHRFDSNWPAEEKVGNVEVVRLGQIAKRESQSVNYDKRYAISDSQKYYGHFWNKLLYIFRAWREAEKTHRERPFDKIWVMMASYGGFAALLFKLRHPRVPMLLTLQEGDSESHILLRVNIFYPFWRLIFKKADHIQTISNYLADFARRHGARCQIEVVPNGVDLRRYNADDADDMPMMPIADTKKISNPQIRIKSANPHYVIITTSRLVYKNGVDVLIRAAVELKFIIPNSLFIIQILGSGPDEEKLKKLSQELGVEKEVQFFGHVEPEEIPKYLSQADIFVRASRSEGLGSSFLEAMAAGLPIIGTPVGGIPDFLKSADANDANGLFVQPDNSRDLAEKILLLLKNDELRKKLGENGWRLVSEKYSWDSISVKINNIFEKL